LDGINQYDADIQKGIPFRMLDSTVSLMRGEGHLKVGPLPADGNPERDVSIDRIHEFLRADPVCGAITVSAQYTPG